MLRLEAAPVQRVLKSPILAQVAAWYVLILVPTIVFKWLFIRGSESDHAKPLQSWTVVALGSDPRPVQRLVRLFFVFRPDILEVLFLVIAAFVVGCLALRIRLGYLMAGTLLVCVLVGGADNLASSQVGTLLTTELIAISWHWGKDNPDVIRQFLTPHAILSPRKLAVLSVAVSWVWALGRLSQPTSPSRLARLAQGTCTATMLSLVGTALLTTGPIVPQLNPHAPDPSEGRLGGFWSSTIISLRGREAADPREIRVPTYASLQSDYWGLVYPGGRPPTPDYLVPPASLDLKPRHIVIIELETAPRKYYPLVDNPDFPTFYELSKHALISDRHYTTAPYTTDAIYSILSGTYARAGKGLSQFGRFTSDGIAAVMRKHGYTTTYVDSYPIDWHGGNANRRALEDLGFQTFVEPSRADASSYEERVQREKASFDAATEAILAADRQGTKAMVFVSSIIGHFPWKSKAADEGRSGREKLAQLGQLIDGLTGSLLQSLDAHGLRNDLVLVVTGDHGLRYEAEFASVNEQMEIGGPAFNVPFILYAPGIFASAVRLPYATSHIDIAPTLLALSGIPTDGLLLQGENMLDQRVSHRLSFLMNRDLTPVDGFYWEHQYFTIDHLTGTTASRSVEWSKQEPAGRPPRIDGKAWSDHEIGASVAHGYEIANETGAYFLHRKALDSAVVQR